MSAKIRSACPNCNTVYTVPAEAIGKTTKCKKCESVFAIQAIQEPTSPVVIPAKAEPLPASRVVYVPERMRDEPEDDRPKRVEVEHRQRGRFGNGFLVMMGVLCAGLVFFGGLTFVVCGGGLAMLGIGTTKVKEAAERARKEQDAKEQVAKAFQEAIPQPSTPATKAEEPKQASDVIVTILDVGIKQIGVKTFGDKEQWSKEEHLRVKLSIRNTSKTKKIDYRPWGSERISVLADRAKLTDNFGNRYGMVTFGISAHPNGAVESTESIYPDTELTDVLVFEKPVKNCEYLTLELPLSNVGEKGSVQLKIDAKRWQKTDTKPTE